ncbi:MAG: 30S ribosomal protein S7 [Chloroflexi bacterium]|jgi:small subunit ribosomal protein S7|nr:MAG: ribosomal protein S7 [Chloroflexi bacterium OLB13]MBC6956324.1 30S ribosomal protein S7 [Chloroflexota bacterium]MBV6434881.1 30S ribosomal protein S7 [Anaerolineae bacterium]MDL1916311.1 30S ribosomal protein S7 [Anaerolineae bacterium CFX4]OQY81417.1 MAG: 30S ribosomal protein S7 [Anaerolineae bacterium UTCFX5]
MPRRNSPPKRQVAPDNKFQSVHITMFINRMMYGGKRSTAMGIMYDAMDIIEEKLSRNPLEIFDQALRNVTPAVEVKPRRVGGSTYQVPVEVDGDRGVSLAMRWLLANSRSRAGKGMPAKLAAELIDAANGQGNSIKKKDETHRMAEANRAFAHYK